jgi:hypothetical protein
MGRKPISNEDALQFLTELQRDLLEDRRTETAQADPIYYGILDAHEFVTDKDHSDDRALVCDDGDIDPQTVIEEELIDVSLINEMLDEGILDTDDDDGLRVADADAFLDFVEENEDEIDTISVAYIAYDEVIKPDAMFLMRKDAEAYLRDNRYHYTNKAKTYAMTACRSHRYETLIDVLRTIDLEKSHIVMAENTREAGGSDNDE